MNKPLLISFVGSSGSGKTTAAKYAEEIFRTKNILPARLDVAEPLRKIQAWAYNEFGRPSPGDVNRPETFLQDGKLLGFLATHFEDYLQDSFQKRFQVLMRRWDAPPDWLQHAVINADCRNNCYEALKDLGFIFIRLQVSDEMRNKRLQRRSDLSKGLTSIDGNNQISESIIINNDGSLSELKDKIGEVITDIINNHHTGEQWKQR